MHVFTIIMQNARIAQKLAHQMIVTSKVQIHRVIIRSLRRHVIAYVGLIEPFNLF